MTTTAATPTLDLDDIQRGVLHPAALAVRGAYLLLRIDDRHDGRELMRRLSRFVASAATRSSRGRRLGQRRAHLPGPRGARRAAGVARHLRLGVPAGDGRPRRGARRHRRERARTLGAPARDRRRPRRARRVAPDQPATRGRCSTARTRPTPSSRASRAIWRQDCHALPTESEPFGFRDGISHPAVEGSGIPGSNPHEAPLKAGEFVLGYPDETGGAAPDPAARRARPQRHLRRLPQAAPARRRVPPLPAATTPRAPTSEELLAAKFMGRWRSGAPARARARARRPRAGRRPGPQQRLPVRPTIRAGLHTPARVAHPAGEPARRGRRRRGAAAPHDPPRHRLRARAARRRAGGRRRRPRPDVRLRRRAPGPAVRVRPVPVDATTAARSSAPGREGPARRRRTTAPARSRSPGGRSAGG